MTASCAVIIPTWNGAAFLPALVAQLRRQTFTAESILVIDSSSTDGTEGVARALGCQVEVIPKAQFNHGGTRNRAALLVAADLLVFMTQDALPADEFFLDRLTAPLRSGAAGASYARQIAHEDAFPSEVFVRSWNYPETSRLRTAGDIDALGVRAYFFSNVAAAVRHDLFDGVGGFPSDVIMNEDMVLCAKLLAAGGTIAYCADAQVLHSHNYTLLQQFRRYFDIGAFFASHGRLLRGSSIKGEGIRFAVAQLAAMIVQGRLYWALRSPCESAVKLIAFNLGKRNRWIPLRLRRSCSMHPFHWMTSHRAGS